jgi:hypothetical protein
MSAEVFLNDLVVTATRGKFGVATNPDFIEEIMKVKTETRNLAARIYDSTTLLIIDDINHRIVTKFSLVRKR